MKMCKPLIKKKKKKQDKIVLLAKTKLNIEFLISRALICSYISCNDFVLVNNALREYGDIKVAITNLKISMVLSKILICS